VKRKVARSAEDYDAAVRWRRRLHNEKPFFQKVFRDYDVGSVLDCGCGPGRHSIMFSRLGLDVGAFDIDEGMLKVARKNAKEARRKIRFFKADLASFAPACRMKYDACVSIGNSLSLAGGKTTLERFFKSAASVLDSGGVLMTQTIDYAGIKEGEYKFVPPRLVRRGSEIFCLIKFFERQKDIVFANFVRVSKSKKGVEQNHFRGRLTPYSRKDFIRCSAGRFRVIGFYGDYRFTPYRAGRSKDLIFLGRKI